MHEPFALATNSPCATMSAKEGRNMNIQLPDNLENSVRSLVNGGRFTSVDEAMTEAARLLVNKLANEPANVSVLTGSEEMPDLLLGSMRDFADEMDEIVADIYCRRQADTCRT